MFLSIENFPILYNRRIKFIFSSEYPYNCRSERTQKAMTHLFSEQDNFRTNKYWGFSLLWYLVMINCGSCMNACENVFHI